MGFFTWTLANRKLSYLRNGDYAQSCKLPYYGYGAIVTPDNELIKEHAYEGYGRFDGHDAYELVAEWNREFLARIATDPRFMQSNAFPTDDPDHMGLIRAFVDDDDTKLRQCVHALSRRNPIMDRNWKRCIGILFAGSEDNAKLLPYPLKIVNCVRPKSYDELGISFTTQ